MIHVDTWKERVMCVCGRYVVTSGQQWLWLPWSPYMINRPPRAEQEGSTISYVTLVGTDNVFIHATLLLLTSLLTILQSMPRLSTISPVLLCLYSTIKNKYCEIHNGDWVVIVKILKSLNLYIVCNVFQYLSSFKKYTFK